MERLSQKSTPEYFENLDSYSAEKTQLVREALTSNTLPTIEDVIRILEIGPGGGGGVEQIRQELAQLASHNDELHAVDLLEVPLRGGKVEAGSDLRVAAKLQQLPYANDSVSAINTSSVFHEVATYDGEGGVDDAIQEINRVLAKNGLWAYRDLGAPRNGLHEIVSNAYRGEIVSFIKDLAPVLLPELATTYPEIEGQVTFEEAGDQLQITAPAGVIREFERHYLSYSKERTLSQSKDPTQTDVEVLERFLVTEGTERYFYNSIASFVIRVVRESSQDDEDTVLFPESPEAIRIIDRPGNDHLLESVSTNPFPDTKQVIGFRKMNTQSAKAILDQISELDETELRNIFGDNFEETISELNSIIVT
jgi:ubiquinone/menaquinone biosynthesis C-methylase UbiE